MYKAADVRAEHTGALAHARARAREEREREDSPGPTAVRLKDLATRFRAPAATAPSCPADHVSIPCDTDGLVCYVIDPLTETS